MLGRKNVTRLQFWSGHDLWNSMVCITPFTNPWSLELSKTRPVLWTSPRHRSDSSVPSYFEKSPLPCCLPTIQWIGLKGHFRSRPYYLMEFDAKIMLLFVDFPWKSLPPGLSMSRGDGKQHRHRPRTFVFDAMFDYRRWITSENHWQWDLDFSEKCNMSNIL